MEKEKIEKSIESIEKQKEKHREKVESYDGKNYALIDYWEKEVIRFENKIAELKEKLGKE